MPDAIPQAQFVEHFLASLATERGYAISTQRAYDGELRRFERTLSGRAAATASADDIGKHLAAQQARGTGPFASKRTVSALREFFRWLVRERYRDDNPTLNLASPKTPSVRPKALPQSQTQRLLATETGVHDWLRQRNKAILELAYGSGLRASEIVRMRIRDVSFDAGVALVMGKGSKERLVPLGEPCLDALQAWIHDGRKRAPGGSGSLDFVFLSKKGGVLTTNGLWRMVKEAAKLAGLVPHTVSPHKLRHSFATDIVEGMAANSSDGADGVNLRAVQMLLGHESIATTTVYLAPSTKRLVGLVKKHHPRG